MTKEKIKHTVQRHIARHGARNLRLRYRTGDSGLRYNERLLDLYRKLDLDEWDLSRLIGLYDKWTCTANDEFADVAVRVVAGKLRGSLERAMYVDHLICRSRFHSSKIRLYRGITGGYAADVVRKALRSDIVTFETRGADSWTSRKQVAEKFGTVLICADVPVRNIIAHHMSNPVLADMGEAEFIVAFADRKIKVQRKHVLLHKNATI